MRLSDLRDATVRTLDGEKLGRVHEVHCDGGRVVAIMCGAASLIERLTARQHGRRIPWERVSKVEKRMIVVAPDSPQRKSGKSSGSRTRQGSRRPSGQRSKR